MPYVDIEIAGLSARECQQALQAALRELPKGERPDLGFEVVQRESRGLAEVSMLVATLPAAVGIIASLLSIMSSTTALKKAKAQERVLLVTFKDGQARRIPLGAPAPEEALDLDPDDIELIKLL